MHDLHTPPQHEVCMNLLRWMIVKLCSCRLDSNLGPSTSRSLSRACNKDLPCVCQKRAITAELCEQPQTALLLLLFPGCGAVHGLGGD